MSKLTNGSITLFVKPDYSIHDYQERARFDFAWFISVLYVFVTIGLALISLLNNDPFFVYFAIATVFALACLTVVKFFPHRYPIVINLLCLSISIVQYVALISVPDEPHLLEGYWMIIVALTAFYTLGNLWGVFYLLLNSILYLLYFNYFVTTGETAIHFWKQSSVVQNSIEFTIAMGLIGYIMYRYAQFNNHVVKLHKEAIVNLSLEKERVDKKNKESVVLLQEIHHRVKNNLQVIVSLLRMQSKGLESNEAKGSFQKAINRIMIMSLVHQNMYETNSLMNIDLKEYIDKLMNNIITANITDVDIKYSLDVDLDHLIPEKIVPLGLILNELITNSLKYAFTKEGVIDIKIKKKGNDKFSLYYFDNGVWKEKAEGSSLGLELIEIFTEQLDGSYERTVSDKGTTYEFNFKK